MGALKDRILETLHSFADGRGNVIKNPDQKGNKGPLLFEIFFWQEVGKEADTQLKQLWEKAYESEVIEADDDYRKKIGETIAAESPSFTCLMKVGKGRDSLDKEAFLAAVAKRARISVEALEELWDKHQVTSKNSLSKRVLEVGP